MAGGDERSEKLMTVEEATLEELDVRDYVPDNLIVEAHRLDDGATTMVCASSLLFFFSCTYLFWT